ncbi:anaphase-promoting complex subunit 11 RING-H2 finger-domain-containing protein [Xylaria intraflava]|nr:anaphase-promoting complex subunit 11 RING-H2 finger-domain-containing protein [Xylaria intraflava]
MHVGGNMHARCGVMHEHGRVHMYLPLRAKNFPGIQPAHRQRNKTKQNKHPPRFTLIECLVGQQVTAMKVKIKEWNAVATWRWDLPEDDVCGICQVHFDGTCPTCKYPGDDCSLLSGKCGHNFHMHCIMEWIKQDSAKGQCPMCRQKFEWNEAGGSSQRQQQQQPQVYEDNDEPLQPQ